MQFVNVVQNVIHVTQDLDGIWLIAICRLSGIVYSVNNCLKYCMFFFTNQELHVYSNLGL